MSHSAEFGVSFRVVLATSVVAFSSFYAPQPLLPLLAEEFQIGATHSAWLLTLPFFCLAVSPIVIGGLLQTASARKVLSGAMIVMALSLVGFALSETYSLLIVFRGLQSLMFPVIFTACMTYASRAGDSLSRQKRVAVYISSTILGGFSGRIFGGFAAENFGWSIPFLALAVVSGIAAIVIHLKVKDVPIEGQPLDARATLALLKTPNVIYVLVIVFATFFTFVGALNVLPFRLLELAPDMGTSVIALAYSGYAIGVFIPLFLQQMIDRFGGEVATLTLGLAVLLAGLVGLALPEAYSLFGVCLFISSGMFVIHATASGFLNQLYAANASLINGAYISNYYTAGALGSIVPVWVVSRFGWSSFVLLQLIVAISALWFLFKLKKSL